MHAQGWKVPAVLLAAALAAACGREAESADRSESQQVAPAAQVGEAAAPAAEAQPAPSPTPSDPSAGAASGSGATPPSAGASPPPPPPQRARVTEPVPVPTRQTATPPPQPEGPVSTPPSEVVRTDPDPSLATDLDMESRSGDVGPEAGMPSEPEPLAAPVGTRIPLVVGQALSTKTTRTGETFDATVPEDVLGADGVVLLPMGTRVRGRVLESFESPGSERPATLAVGVEMVELGPRLVPLTATVTELEHETEARDSDARSAAKVGAGAVAGALLGRIIGGDTKDALKGALAGGLAGAAVAHATRDGHATIPQGARMVIVLDERLVLEAAGGGR